MSMELSEQLQGYLSADSVDEIMFNRLDNGDYRIIAHINDGSTFSFVDSIDWGLTELDYQDVLDYWTHGCTYTFENFDPETEIARANEQRVNFYGDY